MTELTNGVSWLAVVAGAIISFLAGWLWYSTKMSGTKWAEGLVWSWGARPQCRLGRWSPKSSGCS